MHEYAFLPRNSNLHQLTKQNKTKRVSEQQAISPSIPPRPPSLNISKTPAHPHLPPTTLTTLLHPLTSPLQILIQPIKPRPRLPHPIRKIKHKQSPREILPIHKRRMPRRNLARLELEIVSPVEDVSQATVPDESLGGVFLWGWALACGYGYGMR